MTSSPRTRLAARLGFVAGLIAALVAVSGWRVEARTPTGGVNVDIMAVPSGEFGVAPLGSVVRGRSVVAGGRAARGAVEVLNQTPRALPMHLDAQLKDEDLDESIAIEIRSGARRLVRSSLGELRRDAPELWLKPEERARLRLSAWVPREGPSGYQGRSLTITLQPSWKGGRR